VNTRYARTFQELRRYAKRVQKLEFIRPNVLAAPLYRFLLPTQRRGIVLMEGLGRLYVDPMTYLGREILTKGAFEPETTAVFREHIMPGHIVFDVGANEGVMSAFAATLVGKDGCVVAIEPQSRLLDVLEINLALNSSGNYRIVHGAVSDREDDYVAIALFPERNTGGSSIVRKYRWSRKRELVPTFTIEQIAKSFSIDHIDFVKVDVEGYEPEVVRALLPFFGDRRIGKALIEYHAPILRSRGISTEAIHRDILERGYKALLGSPVGGYVLYGVA
jgi:FkbM family methyltransferase